VAGITFTNAESERLWLSIMSKKSELCHRSLDKKSRAARYKKSQRITIFMAASFLHVSQLETAVNSFRRWRIQCRRMKSISDRSLAGGQFANAVAYLSERCTAKHFLGLATD